MINERIINEYFDLCNNHGDPIYCELRYFKTSKGKPVIIVCHSFMAFKDWGFFPYIAERFAEAGYVAVTFNFSLSGVEGDGNRITDFEKFAQNTFTQEVEDIGVVLNAVWNGQIGGGIIDREKIVLLGHSRGGAVAIIQSSIDFRVKMLITLSTIATFERWTFHQKDQWKKLGYLPLSSDLAVSPLRLGIGLLNDLETHREELDVVKASAKVQIPWLIVHGKADVTVPCREAETLYKASNRSTTELVLLDKTGHLYNAAHKDEDNYKTLNKIIDITLNWLQQNIK